MKTSILLNIQDLFNSLPVYSNPDYDVTDYLGVLAGWSSVLGVLLGLLAVALLLALHHAGRRRRWDASNKFLTVTFAFVLLAGFVVYDVGMYIGHNRLSLITNAPMAIVHSFGMFLFESEADAIHDQFHENWIYMMAFSAVHMLAAFVTLVFVIKQFGYNIIAGFKMLFESYIFKSKRQTYVLWGLNDASYQLACSIRQHHTEENDKDYRIVIVRTNQDREEASIKNGMERIFNFLSLKNNDLARLIGLDCFTTTTYADTSKIIADSHDQYGCADLLKRQLGLRRLTRIILHKTSEVTHLFFLNDNDDHNIRSVGNLKRDNTIYAAARAGKRSFFYCKARYNSIHRVIEDEQPLENIVTKVVDPSSISIAMLKQDVALHPVSYVDVEKDATVSSRFHALIVGFGEVGHDALRFLYEYGAFVKTGSDADHVQRSDFHCDIVEKDIKDQAGLFAVNAPAVPFSLDDEDGLITIHDLSPNESAFYSTLEQWTKTLNYVVIALDDDAQNVALAVRIFRLAMRYRPDMRHLRILAKVGNDQGNHLVKITEHYNRLLAAQQSAAGTGTPLHQDIVSSSATPHEPITLFGAMADIYTWDYIVSDRLTDMARRFQQRYNQSIRSLEQDEKAPVAAPMDWDEEHRDLMQLDGPHKGYAPTLAAINRLRRVQSQNKQLCFHQFTKRAMVASALGDDALELLAGGSLSRRDGEITYHWQGHDPVPAVERVLHVLAQTEHLRWVASHELLGYRDTDDENNEARLLHCCLKPWNELSTRIQSYDNNVVDVSLGIL